MSQTLSLSLAALLPDADGCAGCGNRLGEALVASGAAIEAHPTAAGDRLIVHLASPAASVALETAARQQAAALARRYVHRVLPVAGMDCADCARALGAGVASLPGVLQASADVLAGSLVVEYDADRTGLAPIAQRVAELGYRVTDAHACVSTFRIAGLDCADCARTVERVVAAQGGVLDVTVNLATASMTVTHDRVAASEAALLRRVAEAGYQAELADAAVPAALGLKAYLSRRHVELVVAVALLALATLGWFLSWPSTVLQGLAIGVVVVGGWRTARAGWLALRLTRAPDMNTLMSIAVLGALAIGEWSEAAWIVVLFAVGNTLEGLTVERARRSIARLLYLAPPTATVMRDGAAVVEPAEAVPVGATVLVRPGERVALDGVVLDGRSAVDQSPITGESMPADKAPGDPVYAGSVNGDQPLMIRVEHEVKDSTLARIVRLVEQAQAARAPVQRVVDRFARWYTPAVIVGALLVALVPVLLGAPAGEWVYRGLVLLVIACPCALVISTPVAMVAAIGSAARRGILIKGGAHLETLGRVRTIALDKTGTLTAGRPVVTEVQPLDGRDPDTVLALAAAVESRSEHPLGRAIVAYAQRRGLSLPPLAEASSTPGQGVAAVIDGQRFRVGAPRLFRDHPGLTDAVQAEIDRLLARGRTVVLLGADADLLAIIALADQVRPQAAAALTALRRLGVRQLVMVTGDAPGVARAVADQVGVTDVRAGLLPADKTAVIDGLEASVGPVAMVGDGINDAPALARASVGIAMGSAGTATALETADVVLMADDLTQVPTAVRLGRRSLTVIWQNIVLAIVIKVVFLSLAVLGLADLWLAVLADMGGSLLVTANALRLLRVASDRPASPHHPAVTD